MILLLVGAASASGWVLSAGPQASFGAGAQVGALGVGHEVTLGYRPGDGRLILEGVSTSVASPDLSRFTVEAGARYYLTPPYSPQGALSLGASVGLDAIGPGGVLTLGGGMDLPLTRRWTSRVSAGWTGQVSADGAVGTARASWTLLVPPRRLVAVVSTPTVTAPEAPAARQPLDLTALPADALVWVPHPICQWLPPDQAEAALASLPQGLLDGATLTVAAEGFVPDHVDSEGPVSVTLLPEAAPDAPPPPDLIPAIGEPTTPPAEGAPRRRPTGALLVLAHPGDQVRVNDHEILVGEDGVALARVGQGNARIEVLAGGQAQTYEARVAGDHAVWVRVRPPPPTRILFEQNSSALSKEGQALISTMAQNARSWSFVLQGAYSAEGALNYNNRLARERAQVVGAALLAAGVAEDRIAYLDPPPADPNKDPTTQRACNILAVPPERGP